MKLGIDLHTHLPLRYPRNPFTTSLLTIAGRGIDIHIFPEGILLFLVSTFDFVRITFLFDAYLLISVPKNLALFTLVFVIRVFSSDSVSFKFIRCSFRLFLSSTAAFLLPHSPTSQSSAYLTYLMIGCATGLGI